MKLPRTYLELSSIKPRNGSQKGHSNSAKKKEMTNKKSPTYKVLRQECHKSGRADKKCYWSNVPSDMERAAQRNDTRKLYKILGECTGKKKQITILSLKVKDGKILTSSEEHIERWQAHFQELSRPEDNSNRKQPLTAPQNPPHNQAYENVCTDPPSRDEVIKAIQVLKNHKNPGIDGIPAELLKALPEVAVDELHSVITEGWDNEYIPYDQKT